MTSFGLDNKIAVVTGSGRGIGEAITQTLAKNGASVFLIDIIEENVKKVANDLAKEYPKQKFFFIAADLTKSSEVEKAGNHYKQAFEHAPDVVVNNAAICRMREWIDVPESEYDEVLATNLKSVHMVSQYFARLAIDQKRKQSIVNISSFTTYAGIHTLAVYVAAKAGVIGLMKVMSKELGPKGIRVNCVCPGYIRTSMNNFMSDEEFDKLKEEIPLKRIGKPQDVANMVLFLASDLSSFCAGSCYDVHGGHTT